MQGDAAKKKRSRSGCAESTKGGGWRRHAVDALRHLEQEAFSTTFVASQNYIVN
jgi:hypothetical protein